LVRHLARTAAAAEPIRWAQQFNLGPLPESLNKNTFRTLPAFLKIHEITTRAPRADYSNDPISPSGRGVRFQSIMSAFALTRTCGAAWFVPMLALVGAPQMLLGERFKVGFSGGKLRPTTAPADRASPCEDAAVFQKKRDNNQRVSPVRPAAELNR
jgi:hypothetical protein